MQRSAPRATGARYNEDLSGLTIHDIQLAPLRDSGYIDARLANATREVTPTAQGYAVRYSAPVLPGDISHGGSIGDQPHSHLHAGHLHP